MITLDTLEDGKEAIIDNFDGCDSMEEKLNSINIRKGKKVKKIVSQPFKGPVILLIDNRQCAIGHNMAKKIMVDEV